MLNTETCYKGFYVRLPVSSCSTGPVCLHRPALCSFLWQGEVSSSLAVGGNICAQFPVWMLHRKVPVQHRVLASSRAAEFHTCRKHHTVLWLPVGVDSLPGADLPGSPGTPVTAFHPTPAEWGSAMSWAQPWVGKATRAGPQVTNCCLEVSGEMCLLVYWRWICQCVFIV